MTPNIRFFRQKTQMALLKKPELALYYHSITAAFHRNDETDDHIYVQICYYSKTKDIYDFGSLWNDLYY